MALICNVVTSSISPFTFLACDSVNITYDIQGLATVSFTVVSTSKLIDLQSYSTVSFGSSVNARSTGSFSAGRVQYKGIINGYEISPIPGTTVYEHKLTLLAFGCKTSG